jgi:hypothetical protein
MTVQRCDTGFVLRDPALADLLGDPGVLLPLPFTPEATPDEVLAHLRRLNPHRPVHFDDGLHTASLLPHGEEGRRRGASSPLTAPRSGPASPGPLAS